MASLEAFSRRMRIRSEKVVENVDKLVRKVALVADQAIVSATPVDTGRAKSNWIAQLNSPATQTISAYSPGELGATTAQNEQAAIDQASSVISGYNYGDEIHITNNLPYIQRLNDGYSGQAPTNFVETAVSQAVKAVSSARVLDD